jgi:hypothetical protein
LLTGVPQQVSGIRHNSYARARADSVPARIHASGGKVGYLLEGVNWFHELFGEPGDPVFHGDAARDPSFLAQAFAEGASLVIVHLTRTDGAGHGHGAASPEYASEVRQAFDAIARLRAESAKLPGGSDVLWLVGADHCNTPHEEATAAPSVRSATSPGWPSARASSPDRSTSASR